MKKCCFLLFALLINAAAVHAQAVNRAANHVRIKGIVSNESDIPLQAVSVWAARPETPGSAFRSTISSSDGTFSLDLPGGQEYILTFQMLGYETQSQNITLDADRQEMDLGRLTLPLDIFMIDEVVVRPTFETTGDRIVFNFENDPERANSNMYHMLQKMPMILTDPYDGKIYVESPDRSYIVLRNGRRDAQFNFTGMTFDEVLAKLPAMGFSSLELWTVVPLRFARYDYVINVITDSRNNMIGASGVLNEAFNANDGSTTESVNGSFRNFRFSETFSFSNVNTPSSQENSTTEFHSSGLVVNQNSREEASAERYRANLQTTIDISKRQFLNVELNFGHENRRDRNDILTDSIGRSRTSHLNYTTLSALTDRSMEIIAEYQLDFERKHRFLNVSYYSQFLPLSQDDHLTETNLGTLETVRRRMTVSDKTESTHRFQVDYGDVFLNGRAKFSTRAGYLSTHYDRENSTYDQIIGQQDPDLYTRLERPIERIDGHFDVAWNPLNKLNFLAAIQGDHLLGDAIIRSTSGTTVENISQNKFVIGGQFGSQYNFSLREPERVRQRQSLSRFRGYNTSIGAGYNYTERRPSAQQLTTYVNTDNPLIVQRGNPNLGIESYHTVYAFFRSWFPVTLAMNYSFSNDMVVPLTILESAGDEGTRLVTTYANAGRYNQWSTLLDYNKPAAVPRVARKFRVELTRSSLSYQSTDIDYSDGTYLKSQSLTLRTAWFVALDKIFKLTADISYVGKWDEGIGGSRDERPFSLSLRFGNQYKIRSNVFSYTLSTGDLLNWNNRRTRGNTIMPDFTRTWTRSVQRIPIMLTLRYAFGKFDVEQKTVRRRVSVDGFSTGEPTVAPMPTVDE